MTSKAMVKINVRLPAYVVEHFKQHDNYTGAVRAALVSHVNRINDLAHNKFQPGQQQKENDNDEA